LIEIDLGDLKKIGKELAESLTPRLKTEVSHKGRYLMIPDTAKGTEPGVKNVKLQVKHVLHQMGFSEEYRVLAEHHTIRIVKVGERYRPLEREGKVAPPSQSLPYFFP
jgi:hypothetical protein